MGEFLDETRRIVEDLTPPALDQHDLESALRTLCATAQHDGTAPSVTFRMVGDPVPVPAEIAATLLRMAQGALANVRDHADARTAEVTLAWQRDNVTLEVCDDGTGFDPRRIRPMPGRGYGLAAIRERLYTHAGTLTMSSRPGRGTRITAAVPLPEPATPAVRPEPDRAIDAR